MSQIENMLMLCGELGGRQTGETLPEYLRRLIDGLILSNEKNERLRRLIRSAAFDSGYDETAVRKAVSFELAEAIVAERVNEQHLEEAKP